MENITNKELQNALKEFPDDIDILIQLNGSVYTTCGLPEKKFMGSANKDFLILSSPIEFTKKD